MTVPVSGPSSWQEFYIDGRRYVLTARGSLKRPAVFTPEIVFNLAAMGIEAVAMALLVANGDLAENHTMPDLAHALARVSDVPESLRADIRSLGRYEDLCAMTPRGQNEIDAGAIPRVIDIAERLLDVAMRSLPLDALVEASCYGS